MAITQADGSDAVRASRFVSVDVGVTPTRNMSCRPCPGPALGRDWPHEERTTIAGISFKPRSRTTAVLGAVARGEDGPRSDVDILVEFEPGSSLFDVVRLEHAALANCSAVPSTWCPPERCSIATTTSAAI
jgi:hypothetical protein